MHKAEKKYNGLSRTEELKKFKKYAKEKNIPRSNFVEEWENWKERKFDCGEYTAFQLNEWAYKGGY